jgi:hypothetical protein
MHLQGSLYTLHCLSMTPTPDTRLLPLPCWTLQAFDDPEQPYLPDDVLFRQKEQFSDGVGYDWVDGLKAYSAKVSLEHSCAALFVAAWPRCLVYAVPPRGIAVRVYIPRSMPARPAAALPVPCRL